MPHTVIDDGRDPNPSSQPLCDSILESLGLKNPLDISLCDVLPLARVHRRRLAGAPF